MVDDDDPKHDPRVLSSIWSISMVHHLRKVRIRYQQDQILAGEGSDSRVEGDSPAS
jgi:hypothetical protein